LSKKASRYWKNFIQKCRILVKKFPFWQNLGEKLILSTLSEISRDHGKFATFCSAYFLTNDAAG